MSYRKLLYFIELRGVEIIIGIICVLIVKKASKATDIFLRLLWLFIIFTTIGIMKISKLNVCFEKMPVIH